MTWSPNGFCSKLRIRARTHYNVLSGSVAMIYSTKTLAPFTILYYTILYYTILYYTILYYTILYYTIIYYTILYYTILYYTILYYTILYYTIPYHTIPYHTASLLCLPLELLQGAVGIELPAVGRIPGSGSVRRSTHMQEIQLTTIWQFVEAPM